MEIVDVKDLTLAQKYDLLSAAIARTGQLLEIEPPDFVSMLKTLVSVSEEALVEWDKDVAAEQAENKTKH